MSFEELTPAQVKELLCKHVTQQRMITVQELNVFGVGGDVLEEAKHHVPFLLALISLHPYPKITTLEQGFRAWANDIGGDYKNPSDWYYRHQGYAVYQMISKLRKMSHNNKDCSRTDPMFKCVIHKLQNIQKKQGKGERKSNTRLMKRSLLRRLSSSPPSTQLLPQTLTSADLDDIFGAPMGPIEVSESDASGHVAESEDEVDALPSVIALPDGERQEAKPAVPIPESEPEIGKPYWNSNLQRMEMVLLSGEVLPLQAPGPVAQDPVPAAKKRARVTRKRPAAAVEAEAAGTADAAAIQAPDVHADAGAAGAAGEGVLGDGMVSRIILRNANCRSAQYLVAVVDGRDRPCGGWGVPLPKLQASGGPNPQELEGASVKEPLWGVLADEGRSEDPQAAIDKGQLNFLARLFSLPSSTWSVSVFASSELTCLE